MAILRGVLLSAVLAGFTSCFSPRQPACAFSCAADGICPAGYSCGADGVCHRDDGQGTCDIPSQIDAGDAAAADGAADGATVDAPGSDGP